MANYVVLRLRSDQALVLFDWLARTSTTGRPVDFDDQSEQRVLWDLESLLESDLSEVIAGNYHELLQAARDQVRDRS